MPVTITNPTAPEHNGHTKNNNCYFSVEDLPRIPATDKRALAPPVDLGRVSGQIRCGASAGDLVAILAVFLFAAPGSSGNEWAALMAGVGAVPSLQSAGFTFGLYDAASLWRSICMTLCLGLFTMAVIVLGFAGRGPVTRIALVGAAAVVSACPRLIVTAWLERHTAAVAERLPLVGTHGDALSA